MFKQLHRTLCDGKATCTLNPPTLIGDPYPGIAKAMYIDYTCADVPKVYKFEGAEAGRYDHTLTCN